MKVLMNVVYILKAMVRTDGMSKSVPGGPVMFMCRRPGMVSTSLRNNSP
jgi:hypothetical protein